MRQAPYAFAMPLLFVLAGCAAVPGRPSASSDTVWQAQYRATGAQGAMTGGEASRIMKDYEERRSPSGADAAQDAPGKGAP